MKRIAVITGASSGMGRRFAETVNTFGRFDEIWVIARHEAALEGLRERVPFPVRPLALDLTDRSSFATYAKALGQRRQREVLERGTLTEDGDVLSFFFVSALPWLHYSQLEHPAVSADDSNPRISWGKAITNNGRTTLPVSLYVNHALADGLHISQFFAGLERELQTLADSWAAEG